MPSALAPSSERTEKRINLILPERAYAEVYALSKSTKRSLTELVRLGLGLVKIAREAHTHGQKLIVTTEAGKPIKELVIPGL
jgi:hypothetical protein